MTSPEPMRIAAAYEVAAAKEVVATPEVASAHEVAAPQEISATQQVAATHAVGGAHEVAGPEVAKAHEAAGAHGVPTTLEVAGAAVHPAAAAAQRAHDTRVHLGSRPSHQSPNRDDTADASGSKPCMSSVTSQLSGLLRPHLQHGSVPAELSGRLLLQAQKLATAAALVLGLRRAW